MAFHVTGQDGVYFETQDASKARSIMTSISGMRLREGSIEGLREKSLQLFGYAWRKGPSDIK